MLFEEQLKVWALETFGHNYSIDKVKSLGGHSGVTIGFTLREGPQVVDNLVLKMPPPGVARKNNFDVLRQVPLLQALEIHQIKAPRIKWWSDDEAIFGSPYLIMSRLSGESLPDLFKLQPVEGINNTINLFSQAVEELVAIHTIDASAALPEWQVARDIDAEIAHWIKILHKTNDNAWLDLGLSVSESLFATKPSTVRQGLVHGDYYSNNWVFDNETLSGVVDWEGTTIGPSLLDMGWLYMMYEPQSWGMSRRQYMGWQPHPEALVNKYIDAGDWSREEIMSDLPWFRALASFRLAAITAYYFEEHRSGRRPNDAWEMFGEAFPYLLNRASDLLKSRT